MTSVESLLAALSEQAIARAAAIPHDEARIGYRLQRNTVDSYEEFSRITGDYVQHHFTTCVAPGGRLGGHDARSRAKEILEHEYGRRNGDIVSAYNDARDGTNGGLRGLLDIIAEHYKSEGVDRYVRDIFDRHVEPCSWEQKVRFIAAFISRCGSYLAHTIRADQPERYAQNYDELIRAYVRGLEQTSAMFRRL